ncbi:hypothetical protein, partial [Paenibacillus timonensis]|uniref:hypothetical protein n=1 Tax=Paenibacillus timonensis TaxID=225915 RepID=UPI0022E87B84
GYYFPVFTGGIILIVEEANNRLTVAAPALNHYRRKEFCCMDVVYTHVCGLDVHKKNVVACCLLHNKSA